MTNFEVGDKVSYSAIFRSNTGEVVSVRGDEVMVNFVNGHTEVFSKDCHHKLTIISSKYSDKEKKLKKLCEDFDKNYRKSSSSHPFKFEYDLHSYYPIKHLYLGDRLVASSSCYVGWQVSLRDDLSDYVYNKVVDTLEEVVLRMEKDAKLADELKRRQEEESLLFALGK